MNSWVNGKSGPRQKHAELIDDIYNRLVAPYICELEWKADEVEKKTLQRKIKDLPNDNVCEIVVAKTLNTSILLQKVT
ncbi:MAG: hypothetical protein LBL84_01285 [Candidatus Nomurabacteria bacterium]|jgi:hypothetical protein|nr:hypothetical protein [Candidatus Nomurabacteria bacterium]